MQVRPESAALARRTLHSPQLPRRTGSRGPARAAVQSDGRRLHTSGWLFAFVAVELGCQCLLLFPSIAGARVFVRTATFAASIVLTLFLRGAGDAHPARPFLLFSLAVVALSIFHPMTNSLTAGFGTVFLSLAIMGPVFWVPNIRVTSNDVRRLFFLLWSFDTASALIGVLQIYYPGSFQPAYASTISEGGIAGLRITLANGASLVRPMGLTDTPGGAAAGGTFCVIFALSMLLDRPSALLRPFLVVSLAIGCFVLALCQIRSMLVMLVLASAAILVAALKGGATRRLGGMFWAMGAATAGFAMAILVGGGTVTDRLSTLVEDSPGAVFYSNRGIFLEYTLTDLLPQYPLGAGLGRWGMMRDYFLDSGNVASTMIWAEIQWQAWIIDGGIPLALASLVALAVTVKEVFRISTSSGVVGSELQMISVAGFGYSVGLVAMTFDSNLFSTNFGLDFWLLNAVIFAASQQRISGPALVSAH
jgi:hypothetical protein